MTMDKDSSNPETDTQNDAQRAIRSSDIQKNSPYFLFYTSEIENHPHS